MFLLNFFLMQNLMIYEKKSTTSEFWHGVSPHILQDFYLKVFLLQTFHP